MYSVAALFERFGRSWQIVAVLLLLPVWLFAMTDRGIWLPDEPREFNLALNMLDQGDHSIPNLAGTPFLEKPPLLYWIGAAAMAVSHPSVNAARATNLMWSLIVVLSVGALAGRMYAVGIQQTCEERDDQRLRVSLTAALAAGTLLLMFNIQIWYATDAPLLAATALTWLSAWSAFHSKTSRRRMIWYCVLGLAMSAAFFSKNLFGWVTPVFGVLAWILWNRRWDLLRHAGAYVAIIIALTAIGVWAWLVASRPNGSSELEFMLHQNTFGRFSAAVAPNGLEFGHKNHPLKFLALLPMFALPWTLSIFAAARWAWVEYRHKTAGVDAIAFCICSFVVGVVVLMFSATARDQYFGPSLLATCPLLGLWAAHDTVRSRGHPLTRANVLLTVILGAILTICAVLVAYVMDVTPTPIHVSLGIAFGLISFLGWWLARRRSIATPTIAHVPIWIAGLLLVETIAFPAIDAMQNLDPFAARVRATSAETPTLLYCADETLIATLDTSEHVRLPRLCDAAQAKSLLARYPDHHFVVRTGAVMYPHRLVRLVEWGHLTSQLRSRESAAEMELKSIGLRSIEEWSAPLGRSYAIYALPVDARGATAGE